MKRILNDSYLVDERVDDVFFDPAKPESRSMTQQHFAQEVDVNNIVARALKTGILGDPVAIAARAAKFGDFSDIGDYQSACNRVIAAQNSFMELPADVRAKFGGDVGALIEFLKDENNLKEAVELGLIPQKVLDDKVAAEKAAKAAAAAAAGSAGTPAAGTPA